MAVHPVPEGAHESDFIGSNAEVVGQQYIILKMKWGQRSLTAVQVKRRVLVLRKLPECQSPLSDFYVF